jgi:hypothetical protein
MDVSVGSDENNSIERKMTPDKGGDVYLEGIILGMEIYIKM